MSFAEKPMDIGLENTVYKEAIDFSIFSLKLSIFSLILPPENKQA